MQPLPGNSDCTPMLIMQSFDALQKDCLCACKRDGRQRVLDVRTAADSALQCTDGLRRNLECQGPPMSKTIDTSASSMFPVFQISRARCAFLESSNASECAQERTEPPPGRMQTTNNFHFKICQNSHWLSEP